ncbi:hypothetical protein WJX84_008631 [Apatococcus fuscideae]|uniref:Uncharacterized protein n=1 Tax=Apatococcus fuscideae TaxID=2026836 RepID=A0AAW1T476_9CHLO
MSKLSLPSILAATAGYLFTYWNSRINKEREAQIDRINEQLRDLYGPLLACVSATQHAFNAMVRQHTPDGSRDEFVRAVNDHPDGIEGIAYRQWIKEVLQPLNQRASEAITQRADLLESSMMEPLLLQLVAHVSAFKVILRRWEEGHVAERSAIPYPDKVVDYAEQEFRKMKTRQAELLGISNGRIRSKL